jgi:hypothetical protein
LLWTVQFGVQVLLEAVLGLENPAALGAVVVHLVVMFLEFRIAVEELNLISQRRAVEWGEDATDFVAFPARMVILN